MQGQWVDIDDQGLELIVDGGEVICFGATVAYDYKLIEIEDGAVSVGLKIHDPDSEDSFQRNNITGLVMTPEGEFHAYNVKFASRFVRRPTGD